MTTPETMTIRGREFAVTTQETRQGTQYIFTGKRGAVYGTMRHARHPQVMFLVSGRSLAPCTLGEIWLTDLDNRLEPIRGWFVNRAGELVVQRFQ